MPTLATNKRASFDYTILEHLEAGVVLSGAEIKSVRAGRLSLTDSFVRLKDGEAYLTNVYIAPYAGGFTRDYDPRITRKLLLHKKQIRAWEEKMQGQNLTVVPLKVYTRHNFAKVDIALVAGKRQYDKRDTLRQKDAQRDIDRALRGKTDDR